MPPVFAVVAAVATIGSIAATIAGVAILGITAATFSAIALGASLGASLLSSKPKIQNSRENVDRLRASIDPRTPRKTSVGITALATDIRDEEFTDSQTYMHRFIVVASHKINAVNEIWFDDKVAWTLAGGVQGEFVGYLTVAPILEGNAGNAINISARMGTTRRYTGLAYVHLRYKLTGNSKKSESPFAQSVTTRITIRGDGALIYDPRLDSTVAGGVGAHRADNQTTWTWNDDACRNPALQLLFYLLGWKIAGSLAVGKGIPKDRLDLESFAVAANICDELVTKIGGGTEPRYRSDGVWSEGDAPTTVIDMLKASMNADLDDVDGKLRLTVFHNDLATPVADFTDDDVVSDFQWEAFTPLDQSFNIVRGVYTDPSDDALYQPVDYPEISEASPDGLDRIESFDLPMVESAGQAQRLAQLRLNRQKYGGTFKADFQATAWRVEKNSVIRLTFAATGFTTKLFRVAEMELREDGIVPLVLREEDAAIYTAPTLSAPVTAIPTTPFDFTLDPFAGAISDLSVSIVGVAEIVINADYTGTVTTSLPKTQPYKLFADGVDVTSEAAWSVAALSGTISASIGASDGILSVNLSSGSLTTSTLRLSAARAGVTKTFDVKVTKVIGVAPAEGGGGSGGAGSVTGAIYGSTSTTSMVAIGDELTVTVGSGGTVDLSGAYNFSTASTSGSYGEFAQWYRTTGSPTALGTETAALQSYIPVSGEDGYGECTHSDTGRTPAAVEKYQLYGRNNSGTVTRSLYGACAAVSS